MSPVIIFDGDCLFCQRSVRFIHRHDRANAYRFAGRLGEAIPLHERTLADSERVLGADHPYTVASRNNLAYAYQAAGRHTEAVALLERTLADRERILGAEHPQTQISSSSLALMSSPV